MMTTETQSEMRQSVAATADVRQVVGFSFYRVDPAWRRLAADIKRRQASDLVAVVEQWAKKLMVRTYSLAGMKADVDFMIWRVGTSLEELQEMSTAILQTAFGAYLTTPYAYLSMTKRSTYVDTLDPDHPDKRRFITPANSKYLFVYPFVKTRDWYLLSLEERQTMMDEHIKVGSKFVSVRLHTTYSFGLDDQDFVVAFETEKPQDFLDLVMALRETKGSRYTVRDTPIFTCVLKPIRDIAHEVGG